ILERAKTHHLPTYFISAKDKERREFDREVTALLEEKQVDLVLCIGYMRILSEEFVDHWYGRVVNVHPSLLPKYPGLMDLDVHQAVLDAGDQESGCTVHLIDQGVDSGPILIQKRIPVVPEETAESLKAKVQPLEGQAFIELIKRWPMEAIPQTEFAARQEASK
ncbi:MAG: phosphoribosylglycinamide formyltransferase, partial [Verrucomicrobiae bacterium]|nr:phosphoribosylglycinamide formyltransferase [Verrucomicrobiae bacterium]